MNNKKTKVLLLGLVILSFLASGCVNQSKIKELENEIVRLNQVIQQNDIKIKTFIDQAQVKQKDLDTIKNELDSTKNELDGTKKALDITKNELDGTKKAFNSTKNELDGTRDELDNTKKELDSVNNKLKTLTTPPAKIKK